MTLRKLTVDIGVNCSPKETPKTCKSQNAQPMTSNTSLHKPSPKNEGSIENLTAEGFRRLKLITTCYFQLKNMLIHFLNREWISRKIRILTESASGHFLILSPTDLTEEGKCLLAVTSFQATNSAFNSTDGSNSFSLSTPSFWFDLKVLTTNGTISA